MRPFIHQTLHQLRPEQLPRSGAVILLFAIVLPIALTVVGLVIDGGLMMAEHRRLQYVADAAATTAASEINRRSTSAVATTAAVDCVRVQNLLNDASVTVEIPPASGQFMGRSGYVAVNVERNYRTSFIRIISGAGSRPVRIRSVAGTENATQGVALALLDPQPTPITVTGLPLGLGTLALPQLQVGALELLGLGRMKVNGAVVVNANWGRVDESNKPTGHSNLPPYGISCTPILPLTKLAATDIRVSGGVDQPGNYGHSTAGKPSPLVANRMPMVDPFKDLPVPTVNSDSKNVYSNVRGGRTIVALPAVAPIVNNLLPIVQLPPILDMTVVLEPGIYDWIEVVSGPVRFQPGVYIIRGKNPLTGIPLSIIGGQITAEGVLFYITESASYSSSSGGSDASEGETTPPPLNQTTLLPSAVVNLALLGSKYSGLNDPSSPFHGMLFYQQRHSRKPMIFVAEQLLGGVSLTGTIYAKWGQVIFAANGTYDLKIAAGTARFVNVLELNLSPTSLFPPARDVFLVQ